jgi:hypothetical protein
MFVWDEDCCVRTIPANCALTSFSISLFILFFLGKFNLQIREISGPHHHSSSGCPGLDFDIFWIFQSGETMLRSAPDNKPEKIRKII